jgi:2-C-methyl-D-erythritol 2,4-cyclodiphosphate synthase
VALLDFYVRHIDNARFRSGGLMQCRVGQGFDVHAFGPGDHVMIGGVRIAHARGVVAHSDGDVLLHALCDALLGAAALGDIGQQFPDTDEAYRGADSRVLLRRVAGLIVQAGYSIANLDSTIIAQAPKIAPHVAAMRANLSTDLGLAPDRIGIKATTSERLGFIGREEGIAAQAVVLISKEPGKADR